MKLLMDPKRMPFVAALPAIAGFVLRRSLYGYALDGKNLLPAYHPLELALWMVTALTALWIVLAARKQEDSGLYEDNFQASFPAAQGHILLATGIMLTVALNGPAMEGIPGKLWKLSGTLSGPLLIWGGFCRAQGKRPNVLSHGAACVFFVLHLICHYQTWCSNPQLQDYVFAFFGAMGMMLTAYYLAAFDTGRGDRRMLLAVGLLTEYLCIVNLANTEYLYLYVTGGIWAAASLCAPIAADRKAGGADVSA